MFRIRIMTAAVAATLLAAPALGQVVERPAPAPAAQESRHVFAVLFDREGQAIGLARYRETKGGGELSQSLTLKIEDGKPGVWAVYLGSVAIGVIHIGPNGAGSADFDSATGAILPRPKPGDVIRLGGFASGVFQQGA